MAIQKRSASSVVKDQDLPSRQKSAIAATSSHVTSKSSSSKKSSMRQGSGSKSSLTPSIHQSSQVDPLSHLEIIKGNLSKGMVAKEQLRQTLWESQEGRHRRRFIHMFKSVDEAALLLAQDISVALSERIEDLSTSQPEFKSGMLRLCSRTVKMCQVHQENIVVFNEAVPGFTVIVFRKQEKTGLGSVEIEAAAALIQRFVSRTKDKVLTVHCDDALWIFLPALDVKKNVKEMGFYITEEGPGL